MTEYQQIRERKQRCWERQPRTELLEWRLRETGLMKRLPRVKEHPVERKLPH